MRFPNRKFILHDEVAGDSRYLEVQVTVTKLREIESLSFQEFGNFWGD